MPVTRILRHVKVADSLEISLRPDSMLAFVAMCSIFFPPDLLQKCHNPEFHQKFAAVEMGRALGDLSVSQDIVVTTPDEIARRGNVVVSVLRAALREGRVVYERR